MLLDISSITNIQITLYWETLGPVTFVRLQQCTRRIKDCIRSHHNFVWLQFTHLLVSWRFRQDINYYYCQKLLRVTPIPFKITLHCQHKIWITQTKREKLHFLKKATKGASSTTQHISFLSSECNKCPENSYKEGVMAVLY